MITRRSVNALVLDGSAPHVPNEKPRNSRVISYLSETPGSPHRIPRLELRPAALAMHPHPPRPDMLTDNWTLIRIGT